jgi:Phosphopantetheine attachment site
MDSLDLVEIVMEVEQAFELDLPDDQVERLTATATLADLWRIIVRASGRELPGPRDSPPRGDPTWLQLRVLVAHQLGVAPDDVEPDWPLMP